MELKAERGFRLAAGKVPNVASETLEEMYFFCIRLYFAFLVATISPLSTFCALFPMFLKPLCINEKSA